jgi:hypothetical protein
MIDSKGRNLGCFGLAKAEMADRKKKKRGKLPPLQMQFSTALSLAGNTRKSRMILVAGQFEF